jgi:predicted MFS family arabinose efflux permease
MSTLDPLPTSMLASQNCEALAQLRPVTTAFPHATALLFSISCGLAVANVYFAQPLLDEIADEFAISHSIAGIIVTATQIGYGLGLLLLVPLGDLVDRRRLILGQSLLSAFALFAVAISRTTTGMLVAMALVGVLAVVTQMLVSHAAILAHPTDRGRVVGLITSGIVTGILLARTVSGTMSDLLGWRSVYFASALATLAIVAALFKALPKQSATPTTISYPKLIASVFTLFFELPVLRIRAVLALLIFATVTMLLTPLVLPLAAPPFELSHTQAGLFGLAGAAGAIAASRAGRWADRGHAQLTTGGGLAIMLISWLPMALLPYSLWGLVVGIIMIDFGLQAVHVANQALIYRARPQAQSRLTAGYMIFYSIGCAAGSLGSTLIYARAGWLGVCLCGMCISALALAFWALTRHLTPETSSAAPTQA